MRIERQIAKVYEKTGLSPDDARTASREMLCRVQISIPDRVLHAYPHELSGGMQQRIVIAMVLAKNPSLLILDEPTTAPDATVGAEVLDIVEGLRRELGTSVLLISHNLALVSQMCDRVGVLYAGLLVDQGEAGKLFAEPNHPYTAALLGCIPDIATVKDSAPLASILGALPKPGQRLVGCPYNDQYPLADDRCRIEESPSVTLDGRTFRCFHHDLVSSARPGEGAGANAFLAHAVDYHAPALLRISGVPKTYEVGFAAFKAVGDISLDIWPDETLGIVGEAGSGKSTLGRIIMGLVMPDPGSRVEYSPRQAPGASQRSRSAPQMVFQNPDASLKRRHRVRYILGRSIRKLGGSRARGMAKVIRKLAADFSLGAEQLEKRPTQLSGGQKQRVAIARSFAGDPALVICDKPTSALDVSVQASILNLFKKLQAENGVAYVFITHDHGVVGYVSGRTAVMYLGRIVEVGLAGDVLARPHHPYTEVLLSAVPTLSGPQRTRIRMAETPPASHRPSTGCPFQTRCHRKIGAICETVEPPLQDVGVGHLIRCHLVQSDLPRARGAPDLVHETF